MHRNTKNGDTAHYKTGSTGNIMIKKHNKSISEQVDVDEKTTFYVKSGCLQ